MPVPPVIPPISQICQLCLCCYLFLFPLFNKPYLLLVVWESPTLVLAWPLAYSSLLAILCLESSSSSILGLMIVTWKTNGDGWVEDLQNGRCQSPKPSTVVHLDEAEAIFARSTALQNGGERRQGTSTAPALGRLGNCQGTCHVSGSKLKKLLYDH